MIKCPLILLFINLLATISFSNQISASGLQVTPVTLTFTAQQKAAGIWLSNNGKDLIQVQVRTFIWQQKNLGNQLTPTRDIIISPPMIKLLPNEQQLIRVIRNNNLLGSQEQAYRLSINEIPLPQKNSSHLRLVLHYSLPIFIQPLNMPPPSTLLEWQIKKFQSQSYLVVHNRGNTHAQLSDIRLINCRGKTTVINSGLLGYVLPQSTMQWNIKLTDLCSAPNNQIKVMINGERQSYPL
ncbi:molecular chaperone [Providencia vermicola]|uniref:Molecular chaperone n=2 Tax=Providencia vermicola TaxID=333965 RepID=A0AAX3RVC1_9GAMM|nr:MULTISPECIES: molecular chaperone [Providencia]MCR4179745.1 molecular chaperone [Providencia vermicola]URE77497.1 molecular chaperone [Providencia stuartii]USB36633.1 molecular chaperone [Providencia vermicola]WFC05564.1 molecular chaperone [Providencia vermicola]